LITVANESPTVSLHGGPRGFDAEAFEVLSGPNQLTLFSNTEKDLLGKIDTNSYSLFKHISPDGDQGFPGELLLEVLVGVGPPSATQVAGPQDEVDLGSTVIVYRAKVTGKDGAKVVTPINITQVCCISNHSIELSIE
jgi:aldose 1-epimerase